MSEMKNFYGEKLEYIDMTEVNNMKGIDLFIKANDKLIPHLLDYMVRHNYNWGLYTAQIFVVESKRYMKVAFEFDIDENDIEYIELFQGKNKGIFCGEYIIIGVEAMDVR